MEIKVLITDFFFFFFFFRRAGRNLEVCYVSDSMYLT